MEGYTVSMTQTETLRPAAQLLDLSQPLEGHPATCMTCRGTERVTCSHVELDEDDFCLACDEVPAFRRGKAVPGSVSCNACI